MRDFPRLITLLISVGLSWSPGASPHPWDSPLEFRPHIHENGRVIYTNIPKKCFRNGVLICTGLNPIFRGSVRVTGPEPPAASE